MKKILLIEDNESIRENAAEILQLSNYEVILAENGKAGLARAIETNPDLIICDIMMPELDGYGVLHAVHKNEALKNTPFIFLTAKTERPDLRKGMDLGADDYIFKPFSGTDLLNAVDSRIRKIEQLKLDLSKIETPASNTPKSSLSAIKLRKLSEGRVINKYKRKQVIYTEGNHPNRLYFLVKGKIKAFKTNENGKELVTDLYTDGDFFGHVSLLQGSNYRNTTEALEASEVAIIPKEEFDELINSDPDVTKIFVQLLAANISKKEDQLLALAYNSLRKKVADAILTLQKKYQGINDECFVVDINRESLAAIAGTATESLIRTLGDFRNEKLIDIRDGAIAVLDEKKLKSLVN